MDQATEDLQGLLIYSIEACCTSLRANMPLTDEQTEELNKIYGQLLALQKEATGQATSD